MGGNPGPDYVTRRKTAKLKKNFGEIHEKEHKGRKTRHGGSQKRQGHRQAKTACPKKTGFPTGIKRKTSCRKKRTQRKKKTGWIDYREQKRRKEKGRESSQTPQE